jgi:hypothetical protein
MSEDKERVAWKIWDGEGFDYYFVNWTGPELEHIKEVVTENEWTRLKLKVQSYLKARQDVIDLLEEFGLGADYEEVEEEELDEEERAPEEEEPEEEEDED